MTQGEQGDAVTITLPNLTTTPGTVSSVGTVATAASPGGQGGDPTISVEITLTDLAGAGGLADGRAIIGSASGHGVTEMA